MPARRSSSETGQAQSDARAEPEIKATPGERRRAIPRPNLEAASKLKTYVGNAIDTASRGPAWLASKAVPVAADGAGLFRNAAADAADRVALFRRSKHYDELEEELDDDMKRRTMHLSSADVTPDHSASAEKQHRVSGGQEHERQGAASQQDASDSLSMHSPGPSEASVARSGRGSVPLEEEPAMISFEDDIGPVTGSRGVTDSAQAESHPRPASASSSLSAATSDLWSDSAAAGHSTAGSWVAGSAMRSPVQPLRPATASTPVRANGPAASYRPGEASPPPRGTPIAGSNVDSFKRGAPPGQLHASGAYEGSRGLESLQRAGSADGASTETESSQHTANGLKDGSQLSAAEEDGHAVQPVARSASLQPLIGRAITDGGPPKAARLRPSRPPPPPPSAAELEGSTNRSVASRQSSASSMRSAPEKGPLHRSFSESGEAPKEPAPETKDSWDIFEPRAPQEPKQAALKAETGSQKGAACDLKGLKHMTGKQLLQSLEKGSVVRKKWVTHMQPAEIASAAKTTRTVRCTVKDSKMCLQYAHQGVKGLLESKEVSATVQRVEVSGGNWQYGATILIYTSRGVLALEPIGPAAYSQWVLGLNAALVACQTRRKDYVYSCPAHLIPRNSMFVVSGAPAGDGHAS